ncbi:MAG: T9SS type A sorting domain-containing protein [Bacteroidales bacterium]|nr:T9SS type A sorting domain-containing protein [Bacteroidales bacterium]
MKNYFFCCIFLFSALFANSQFNISFLPDDHYCHHAKCAENYVKSYYSPLVRSDLLDHYDVHFYFLDLNVENNTIFISGNVTIQASSRVNALDTFAFELSTSMTIDSLFVNGIQKSFQHANDLGLVPLSVPVSQGELFSVQIFYQGTPPTGGFFSGVSTAYSTQYQKNVTWTLSEPYAAKDWWPTKQDLHDKADSVWVFLTTSPENKAGSQGLLTGITNMPGGKVRYEWKSYYPIAYYLISFAVADYQEYNIYAYPAGTDDSVFIQNYIYNHPDCLPNTKSGIDQTAPMIELFSDLFGLYPFIDEKYGHCLTQLGGGMEHQTMSTMGGFGFGLVAHELGHMWFGDKVTCATWSDIWINEGFATYSDYLAHSFLTTPYYDSLWLKIRHDQVKSQPGGSVYVPEEELGNIWRIFDGRLSYSKGSLLLHMIRFELQDDDVFFDVLMTFVEEYGDSVATGDDFREWLEFISGQDFTGFFDQWYYGEGFPIYDITWNQDENNLYITSTQTTSTTVTTLFKMLVPYYIRFQDGTDTTLLLFQDENLQSYTVPLSGTIEQVVLDPKQWILHKLNSLTVVIEEISSPVHFTVGPNPAKGYVNIFLSHDPVSAYELTIQDLTGRILRRQTVTDSGQRIDISGIGSGMYIVSLTNGSEEWNRKLLIN